jgi:hypothetical protein
VTNKYASKLASLGFDLPHWCDPPSEELVAEFERRFTGTLPGDYREFLVHHGGVTGSAACSFQEPTPYGTETVIDCFFGFGPPERGDNINKATELIDGAPSVVAIGDNLMGAMFWLKCDGDDAGHVYMHDHEGRSAWTDEMFADWYPNLAPEIRKYLKLRQHGELPRKPKGYEHVYRLAPSFTEFIDGLEPSRDSSQADAPAPVAGFWSIATAWLPPFVRKMGPWAPPGQGRAETYDRICKALVRCDDAVLKELVAAGKLNEPMDYGWTPVEIVARDMKPLEWLLSAGANLQGALCSAAKGGAVDVVRFLLETGCAVEERSRGMTPLMKAVEFPYPPERVADFIEVARILIQHGADVNAISDDGKSVLRIAGGERYSNGRTHGQPEVVAFLETAGAKLNPL